MVVVSMEFATIPFNLRVLNANGEIEYVTDHLGRFALVGPTHRIIEHAIGRVGRSDRRAQGQHLLS